MKRGSILDAKALRKEIEDSHNRSREYGISAEERNPNQVSLSPAELEERRVHKGNFLEVVKAHIDEFYDLISPNQFMIAAADDEGWAGLGAVGQHISKQASFDARNYGYAKLKDLFQAIGLFEIRNQDKVIYLRDKKQASQAQSE